jgi:hypothetical protein
MALARAIAPSAVRFIVMLSAQADAFGIRTRVIVGSMPVLAGTVIKAKIVPVAGSSECQGRERQSRAVGWRK